jgi:hypothetical protein
MLPPPQQRLRLLQIEPVEPLSEPAVHGSQEFLRLLHVALVTPEAREAHLTASTREGRTAEVSKCHAAGHLVAVKNAIEFERQRHRVGNRYLPR